MIIPQDDAEAQFNLGRMYANGDGVPQDDAEAYTWFAVAVANGHEHAKDNLAMVKSHLTPEQLAAERFQRPVRAGQIRNVLIDHGRACPPGRTHIKPNTLPARSLNPPTLT